MVKDLFREQVVDPRSKRQLTIFPPHRGTLPEPKKANEKVIQALEEIDNSADLLGQAVQEITKSAELLFVPINDDDNEVRAAHLRQGGDGIRITFAQFQHAVNEVKRSRTDYAFNPDMKGEMFGDPRRLKKSQVERGLKQLAQSQGAALNMGSFGAAGVALQALLIYGLNELMGVNRAPDIQQQVSGKYPPGTETGGLFAQIMRALVMMRYIYGMTEQSAEDYATQVQSAVPSLDWPSTIKEAYSSPPPQSAGFDLMRANLAASDSEIISRHCVGYTAKHIGDGFETWFGYLTVREMHEKTLREGANAKLYRDGVLTGSDKRGSVMLELADLGITELARLQGVLGADLNTADACCLTRFLLNIDVDLLEALRAIIHMSLALLESEAAIRLNFTLDSMIDPVAAIRTEVLRMLDGVIDTVIEKILDLADVDGEVADIIRACTPVTELITSVVDQVEWVRDWYTNMLNQLSDEYAQWEQSNALGWDTVHKIRINKEQLKVLDRLIDEKQGMLEASAPESQILGLVDEVKSYRKTYKLNVNVYEQVISTMKKLVQNDISRSDREKMIDSIDRKLAAGGIPEERRSYLRGNLLRISEEKNDTKLNEALSYVEELLGDNLSGEGQHKGVAALNDATREMIDWCRDLGDWDRVKGLLGAKTEPETK